MSLIRKKWCINAEISKLERRKKDLLVRYMKVDIKIIHRFGFRGIVHAVRTQPHNFCIAVIIVSINRKHFRQTNTGASSAVRNIDPVDVFAPMVSKLMSQLHKKVSSLARVQVYSTYRLPPSEMLNFD